jgi:hypothetical protein
MGGANPRKEAPASHHPNGVTPANHDAVPACHAHTGAGCFLIANQYFSAGHRAIWRARGVAIDSDQFLITQLTGATARLRLGAV